ncbi:hypothetical protein [Haloferax sulfurifontis]|uniref:Uncharacterized protein n=2 Tax=Haloferax sulfurifontis TaxID=255616 RepID=M0IKQ6_9EURY|nr:hypothetical protein [Haloferax sulfurifontis]ELZ96617.1 hypothetical protein C441_04594 [Haloferax sulfurifontis ATCC BAA-897]GGC72444.1 hypothetical protein GCM10007209_37960 [Haloferax sulfurifontis]
MNAEPGEEHELTLTSIDRDERLALLQAIVESGHDLGTKTDMTVSRLTDERFGDLLDAVEVVRGEFSDSGAYDSAKAADSLYDKLEKAAIEDATSDWEYEAGDIVREAEEPHAAGGVPLGKSEYRIKYRLCEEDDGSRKYYVETEEDGTHLYSAGVLELRFEAIPAAESRVWSE